MPYKHDDDLEFLKYCSNDDLDILVQYLIKDTDGHNRYAQTLTTDKQYKKYYPDHQKYYGRIAEELQRFGGNTFVNVLRNGGVNYKEILLDICKKKEINFDENSSIEILEQHFMFKILEDMFESISLEEIIQLLKKLEIINLYNTKTGTLMLVESIIKQRDLKSLQLFSIIADCYSQKLLRRYLGFTTTASFLPTLLALECIGTSLFFIGNIAGSAFRVTIPCCIQIAYMRMKHQLSF